MCKAGMRSTPDDRAETVPSLAVVIEECERNADTADWYFGVIFADAAYWLRKLSQQEETG